MMRMSETAQRLTMRQIADLAGVSIATVSRVLNGREDVSEETRGLVSRVIRENGYTANRNAQSLSGGRTGLVGVLVPLVFPAYFSGILAGAAEALSERDFQIVLSPTGHEHEREVSIVDRLHGLTDGAMIILPEESSEELERLLDSGFRFVVLDPLMPLDERIPSVSAAHMSGADQAMKHLLDLGHRRVGQITGPLGWVATEDRRRGYRAALAAAGILPDPTLEREAEPEIEPLEVAEQTREQDDALTFSQHDSELLSDVNYALRKIEDGSYGVSEASGEPIRFERLRAVPWARTDSDEI